MKNKQSPEETAAHISDIYFPLTNYTGTLTRSDCYFPIGKFATDLGFTVTVRDIQIPSLTGYIACDDTIPAKRLIAVDENNSKTEQRFTIAHELWHYFKRIDCIDKLACSGGFYIGRYTSKTENDDINQEEQEADQFAIGLLVPRDKFTIAFEQADDFYDLAMKFGVSKERIQNRAKELQYI